MHEKDFSNTIEWYNNNAEEYSKKLTTATSAEAVAEFIAAVQTVGSEILDAGCGDGRYTAELARQGADVVGLDLSAGLLDVAKKNAPEVKFVQGDFTKLPFEKESFAGVWAHASLVHLPTPELVKQSLQEFNRVLKPDGGLHIKVKKQTGPNETEVVSDSLSEHDRFFRYYTEDGLKVLLEEAGFTVEELYREGDAHGRLEVSWLVILARKN